MIREVKSFDSLDSYVKHHIRQWEQVNPQPKSYGPEIKPPPNPTGKTVLVSSATSYIRLDAITNASVEIRLHTIKDSCSISTNMGLKDIRKLIENLINIENEMLDWQKHDTIQAIPKEIQRWKSKRGNVIYDLKCKYREMVAEGKVSS